MNTSETFCLKWKEFQTVISDSIGDLTDYSDVTLACEDEQLEAHRFILSTCSPFFKTVLKLNKHQQQHPWIYLKGIKAKFLKSILTFMYNGQVEVAQDDIDGFLEAADELRVKGLSKQLNSIPIDPSESELQSEVNLEEFTYPEIKEEEKGDVLRADSFKDIIANKIIKEEDNWKCKECGKIMTEKNNMKRHIETHVKGMSFICLLCDKTCKSSNALNVHKSRMHKSSY